jgi:hypothetical protein
MDLQNLIHQLINRAESGEHTAFSYIQTWREYVIVRETRKIFRSYVKGLRATSETLFKHYCRDLVSQKEQFSKLLTCSVLDNAAVFYEGEINILEDMLDEYETYLFSGNWLDFLFLRQRPYEKLWDHRKD